MLKIVLVDWDGYPLKRQKRLGKSIEFECGILPLFDSFKRFDPGTEIDVHLVIAGDRAPTEHAEKYNFLADQFPFISEITFRKNTGLDLGSYNTGLKRIAEVDYSGNVVLMNSSCRAPERANWTQDYASLFNNTDRKIGLCGISMTTILYRFVPRQIPILSHSPHVQSFFLYTHTDVVNDCFPAGLPIPNSEKKRDIIRMGEVEISTTVLRKGYSITSRLDPQVHSEGEKWTGTLNPGFRFSKGATEIVNRI